MYFIDGKCFTLQTEPFLMRRPLNSSGVSHVGNDRFEGYCADLARKLFNIIPVDYKIEIVKDGKYGDKNGAGSWDGMVGELLRGVSGPLQWCHQERDGVSNHQPHDCLLNPLFRRGTKKTSKLRVTGLCEGNSRVTSEFPAQRASNAENVSIWWHHHGMKTLMFGGRSV